MKPNCVNRIKITLLDTVFRTLCRKCFLGFGRETKMFLKVLGNVGLCFL